MKKQITLFTLLLLLLLPGKEAWAYTVVQDVSYSHPNCNQFVNDNNGNWKGGEVTVFMTHDMFNVPSSPNFASLVNNTGWRILYYDIYNVGPGGIETLETTISRYHPILHNGVYSGSSSTDYSFNVLDLINAGVTAGEKRVKLRVYMQLTGKSFPVSGRVREFGTTQCFKPRLDGSNMTCDIGMVDCFTYAPCNATVNAYGLAYLIPRYDKFGNIVGYTTRYRWNAVVNGGSGSYSYAWSNTLGNTGSGSQFQYTTTNSSHTVYLTVTDNVTGCVYSWSSNNKSPIEVRSLEVEFAVGPNPMLSHDRLKMNMNLPLPDTWKVSVYDLEGQLVLDLDEKTSVTGGREELLLEHNLSPGIYLVQLKTDQHGNHTKKLVVQ